jgi:hypothetical protein
MENGDIIEVGEEDFDIRKELIRFRDSTIHSSPHVREPLERAIRQGIGQNVELVDYYRVCAETDAVFVSGPKELGHFVSACGSIDAARRLLIRPPNPMANLLVRLTVVGKVIHMVYDDGRAGSNKQYEEEIIVPLAAIRCVQIINI